VWCLLVKKTVPRVEQNICRYKKDEREPKEHWTFTHVHLTIYVPTWGVGVWGEKKTSIESQGSIYPN
jgi:hypothetical protein